MTRDLGEERPDVSVLIVNFESTPLLRACLDALLASTVVDRIEIIAVDNASSDFDADSLSSRYPMVQFLPQDRNTTFTGGTNLAFAQASGRNVLLLNPDTRIDRDAIEHGLAHLASNPEVVAIGALLIEESGELQRYYRRLPAVLDVPIILFEPLFRRTPRGRRFLLANESFVGSTLVEQPPGAFLLIRRHACPDPVLDSGYFNFLSDVNLCDLLRAKGEVRVYEDVRCVHLRGGAGAHPAELTARFRLHQDMTWGLRRYFAARTRPVGRAYLEAWLGLYWASRIARAAIQRPTSIASSVRFAASALFGRPPSY